MKVRTDPKAFSSAVAAAAKALTRSSTSPLLSGLTLEATEHGLVLSAYSEAMSVLARIPGAAEEVPGAALVHEPGKVLVSGWLLANVAKRLPSKPLDLTANGALSLECGSAAFELPTLKGDFPVLPEAPPIIGRVPPGQLNDALARTAVAADGGKANVPQLTGAMLGITGDRLFVTCTDRYRVAQREVPFTWSQGGDEQELLALTVATRLRDALGALGEDNDVVIGLTLGEDGGGLVMLESGQRRVTLTLMEPKFPKFGPILAVEPSTTALVDAEDLADAAELTGSVSDEDYAKVRLRLEDGQILLNGSDKDGSAKGSQSVPAEISGDAVEAVYRGQYLADALRQARTSVVRLGWTAAKKPMGIIETTDDGVADDHRHFVMPVIEK